MLKIKKYVLFSPVGTHDPVGVVDKDGKPSEGSMLHIIRHYKPEVVYLYITKELNYNDNRYEKAIKKFHPNCKVEKILSKVPENKVHSYDAFINDFKNNCKRVQKKSFTKGQVITSYIEKRNQFCILVSGNADLVRYDLNGNRTIIEHFSKNDIFGEVFYTVTTNNELLVEAREKCESNHFDIIILDMNGLN